MQRLNKSCCRKRSGFHRAETKIRKIDEVQVKLVISIASIESWCHSHQATSRPCSNQSEPQESELIGKRAAFDANVGEQSDVD